MRKLFSGLSLVLLSLGSGYAACNDTTIVVTSSPYTPGTAGTGINAIIAGCTDATMTVHLRFAGDTLKLANEIVVSGRSGKTTRIVGENSANDSILTLVENTLSDPQLLNVNVGNTTILSNLGFARKTIGPGTTSPSVLISADSSSVSGCHFWMADNSTSGTGPLLDISANSVLVERCLFRAPPDGVGRSIGLHTGGSATRVEIRSSVFFSTGLQLAATGTVHVIANTFTGSRNEWNAIIIGSSVTTPEKSVVIQHNLFAHKADTLPPIAFSTALAASDSILKNAWSRGKSNMPLAVNSGSVAITLNGNSGANINTPLPRGFSNFGPSSSDVKDFPLTELRSDPTLVRKNNDFGKMFRVYTTTNWTGMSDIKDLGASKLYFPGFTPFLAGRTWLANVKVGAFVDQDTYETPSPLDSGTLGASLKFSPLKSDSTKIKLTGRTFDGNYYKSTTLTPEFMQFFFSDTLAKLTASNDSNALKASVKTSGYIRKTFLGDDSILTVPKEVRLGSQTPFYVKMLHYRQGQQAPVLSSAAIATVLGVPSYPINDLTLKLDPAASDFPNGRANITVTRGSEAIDSVAVVVATENGQGVDTIAKAASGSSLAYAIDVPKGTFVFYAIPIAKLGSTVKYGQATPNSAPATFRTSASDTVFVTYKTTACPTADGTQLLPYCSLDSAMKDISTRNGGTVIIKNGNPAVAMEDITIAPINGTDVGPVNIITNQVPGKYEENRPVFRGKTKEALTITRKNVTLKGFFIEMPAASGNTALNIKASGAVIEGNIFRAVARGAVEGAAVNIDVGGTADARFVNNLVWGFTKNVQVTNAASANVRVINNTFVDDASLSNTGKTVGVLQSGTGTVSMVLANNFFSGIATPIDATLKNKTPPPTLDHNVYTGKPDLQGLTDAGDLDPSSRILSADIWATNYIGILEGALASPIECGTISPCNALYAGSINTATIYSTTIDKDVLGKSRSNRKEIGAFELNANPATVMGVLAINPSKIDNDFTRINWTVSAKTFDPVEADSLHVFWSTSDLGLISDASLSTIPAAQQKHFPISALSSGNISDFAGGIKDEATLFHFYAALGRTSKTGTRTLGYSYRDTITSGVDVDSGDCEITTMRSACPSTNGQFIVKDGAYAGKFVSRVTFTEPVSTGLVKNPGFDAISVPKVFNLDLTSPLPAIKLNVTLPGLGAVDSKQTFKADITMDALPDLSGFDLFLIPSDASGMASYVSNWTVKQEGGKTRITIESNRSGSQTYAFGKMQASMEPGSIIGTDASVPVFDFTTTKDSVFVHVPVKFKGTGFKTANPLVLITVLPAGGMVSGVFGGTYHSHTIALSSGFANLADSLKRDRFYKYYLKAAASEPISSMTTVQQKPFLLDSTVSAENFAASTEIHAADVTVAGGNLDETTVILPILRNFKDFAKYADLTGKASRSIEVEYTVFDGAEISRSRTFIRTRFSDQELHISEKKERGFENSTSATKVWNLFGYPWDEADTGSLARVVNRPRWDNDNMRLMRYKGNGSGADAFNVYDGSNPDVIKYDAGQASWSGSTSPYTPSSATGMSLDFETFSMPLSPNQWTDIALPFNFPIKWIDVLDSSGIARDAAPAAWKFDPKDKVTGKPSWKALEVGSANPPVASTILRPWEGYTIRPKTAVTLKFPILDTMRSMSAVAKVSAKSASQAGESWTARLVASSDKASMFLRIGMGASESTTPEAPDVPGQDFRVALKHDRPSGAESVSGFIRPMTGSWQGHWALQGHAANGGKGINLRLADASRSVPVYLVETLHKTAIPLSGDAPIGLSESDLKANDYHIVAGDKDYLNSVLEGLVPLHLLALSNYPNPFAGSTLIRYALPEGFGKVAFDLKVRDFRGRTVWEKSIRGGSSLNYLWDGKDRQNSPLPAGVYTLSLEASATGKPVFKATRRMLRM
ncbi:MAG: hypothetical protein JWP91_495 [Fibrobacteres bacterium]|nr:hypothetical protein [Fibrobacterota bacterium]